MGSTCTNPQNAGKERYGINDGRKQSETKQGMAAGGGASKRVQDLDCFQH